MVEDHLFERLQTALQVQDLGDELLQEITHCAKMFRNSNRFRIFWLLLSQGSNNVTQITNHLSVPQPLTSHELGLLRTSGVISSSEDETYRSKKNYDVSTGTQQFAALLSLLCVFANDKKSNSNGWNFQMKRAPECEVTEVQ